MSTRLWTISEADLLSQTVIVAEQSLNQRPTTAECVTLGKLLDSGFHFLTHRRRKVTALPHGMKYYAARMFRTVTRRRKIQYAFAVRITKFLLIA